MLKHIFIFLRFSPLGLRKNLVILFKYILARLKRREGIVILDCEDVTSEYENVSENERIFYVRYVKLSKEGSAFYMRYIRFTGEYSENPEIAMLQKYCIEHAR